MTKLVSRHARIDPSSTCEGEGAVPPLCIAAAGNAKLTSKHLAVGKSEAVECFLEDIS